MLTKRLKEEWRDWERRERKLQREEFGDQLARDLRSEDMARRQIVSRRAKRKITHGPMQS